MDYTMNLWHPKLTRHLLEKVLFQKTCLKTKVCNRSWTIMKNSYIAEKLKCALQPIPNRKGNIYSTALRNRNQ